MPKAYRHRKFMVPNLAKPDDSIRDPQITEQAYQLLAQGTSPKDLLAFVTSAALPRPTPPVHKFKLRGPLKDQIPELDAYIARGLVAGLSVPELMAQVLPSIANQQQAKAARIKEDNERATAKCLARIAEQNAPEKRAGELRRFQKRLRATARKNVARAARLEREEENKKVALAANPTATWRHPRRRDWAERNAAIYRKPKPL